MAQFNRVPVTGGEDPTVLIDGEARVVEYHVTSSGFVVYLLPDDTLHAVSVEGGDSILLSDTLIYTGARAILAPLQLSDDGNTVIFLGLTSDRNVRLFSVPVAGGETIQLSSDDQTLGLQQYSLHSFYFTAGEHVFLYCPECTRRFSSVQCACRRW